ncbi:putative Cystatin domain-containing protein [Medicago truncatula]|uniref:Phloem filament protein PP1 n=1 Tax=Medicago truncatula TaxID=3880 RepID=G7KD51_MEDTR|nr:phloem filament protein PP1 [Medicago truncatula]RHN57683.1 putative Cystatin domain-containing protein [Medicago truncatula]
MRFQSLVLILAVLFASFATNQAIPPNNLRRININDPRVIEMAGFAIIEHNNQITGAKLRFEKLVDGYIQKVGLETDYHLTISAKNGSTINNYEAVVFYSPIFELSLKSFVLIHA